MFSAVGSMILEYSYVILPAAACFVLAGIHAYLGIHVLARNIIFVDLALAQISALGYAWAIYLGYETSSPQAYGFSLAFTVCGAALFAVSRLRDINLPQEAFIGVIYVVSGAVVILVLDRATHGAEHMRELLEGSIVWVQKGEVAKITALYGAIAAVHYLFRHPIFLITFDPAEAVRRGLKIRWWDFLFYVTFGFVVTSSVQIAGVLLVFTFLIVPSLISALFFDRFPQRLFFGWALSAVISVVGLLLSYNRPSGPVIITLMGGALLAATVLRVGLRSRSRLP